MNAAIANQLIEPHQPVVQLRKKHYRTDDIVALVQEVLYTDVDDTRRFASQFSADKPGMKAVFDFVDRHITYVEDPSRNQWVQTPSFLWYTRRGDCKSFSVFISSILQNMGVPHYIRYVSYNFNSLLPRQYRPYTHVYPVAIIRGQEVPIDVVWKKQDGGTFGAEKHYSHKKDIKVQGLYKLGNTRMSAEEYIGQVQTTINELESAMANVPDEIVDAGPGDITQMTKGELERWIWEDRYTIFADQETDRVKEEKYRGAALAMRTGSIAGIGSLSQDDAFSNQVKSILSKTVQDRRKAFEPFTLKIPNVIDQSQMSGFFQNVGKFFKKVGETFANLFKKLVNWVFKGVGKNMGPYFIFLFIKKQVVKSKEIKRRIAEQEKTFGWIQKIGKFDANQLKGLALNGIKEKTGKTPTELFKEGGTPALGTVVGAVITAIQFVVQVVKKVADLFKKGESEAGDIGQANMSDTGLLEEEARLQAQSSGSGGGGSGSGGGGGGGALAIAALAIPFLLKAA